MAKISAHETTPGQTFSTFDLMSSTTLKPLTDLLLGPAVFSPVKEDVSSRRIDPSQPCQQARQTTINLLSFKWKNVTMVKKNRIQCNCCVTFGYFCKSKYNLLKLHFQGMTITNW
jgi:hypothetical protein